MRGRRDLLATLAAATVLPTAAAQAGPLPSPDPFGPEHPDAALLAACAEYLRIQWEFAAYYDTLPGDMEADDPGAAILVRLPTLAEQIISLRATTADGHLARGRCLAFQFLPQFPGCQDDPEQATEDRFRAAMLRDLVEMERGARA